MELGAHNFHEGPKGHLTGFNGARERQVPEGRECRHPQGRVVFEAVDVMAFDCHGDAERAAPLARGVVVRVRGPCIDPAKADEAPSALEFKRCRHLPFPAIRMGTEAEPGTFDAGPAGPSKWDDGLVASPSGGAQFPAWGAAILRDRRHFRNRPFRPADRLFRDGRDIAP